MQPKDAERIANSVDPDQEPSDLGLDCLPRPVCPKNLTEIKTKWKQITVVNFSEKWVQIWDILLKVITIKDVQFDSWKFNVCKEDVTESGFFYSIAVLSCLFIWLFLHSICIYRPVCRFSEKWVQILLFILLKMITEHIRFDSWKFNVCKFGIWQSLNCNFISYCVSDQTAAF